MMEISTVLAALSDEEFAALLTAAIAKGGSATVLDRLTPSEKTDVQTALARLAAGEPVEWTEVRAKLMSKLQ